MEPPCAEVLMQNDNYLVINKPADVRMTGDFDITVEKIATSYFTGQGLECPPLKWIHQLDYATSGVLCIGLNRSGAAEACLAFENRVVHKQYLAVLQGHVKVQNWPLYVKTTEAVGATTTVAGQDKSTRSKAPMSSSVDVCGSSSGISSSGLSLVRQQKKKEERREQAADITAWQHVMMKTNLEKCIFALNEYATNFSRAAAADSCCQKLQAVDIDTYVKNHKLRKELRKYLKSVGMEVEMLESHPPGHQSKDETDSSNDKEGKGCNTGRALTVAAGLNSNQSIVNKDEKDTAVIKYAVSQSDIESFFNISDQYVGMHSLKEMVASSSSCRQGSGAASHTLQTEIDFVGSATGVSDADQCGVCRLSEEDARWMLQKYDCEDSNMISTSDSNNDNSSSSSSGCCSAECTLTDESINVSKSNSCHNKRNTHVRGSEALFISIPVAEREGEFRMQPGTTENPGKPSETIAQIIERGYYQGKPVTKVLLTPKTGRRHQLRVHCLCLGHPIVGDYTYNLVQRTAVDVISGLSSSSSSLSPSSPSSSSAVAAAAAASVDTGAERMMLHAHRLRIPKFLSAKAKRKQQLLLLQGTKQVNDMSAEQCSKKSKTTETNQIADIVAISDSDLVNVVGPDPFQFINGVLKL